MNELNQDKISAECSLIGQIIRVTGETGLGCLAIPVQADVLDLEHEKNIPIFNFNDMVQIQSPCEFNEYQWTLYFNEVVNTETGERGLVHHRGYENVLQALAAALTHVVSIMFVEAGEELGMV